MSDDQRFCGNCGKEASGNFCSQCGARQGGGGCKACGAALAPGAIVHAVHSGHSFARGLVESDTLYLRDEPVVPAEPTKVFPQR